MPCFRCGLTKCCFRLLGAVLSNYIGLGLLLPVYPFHCPKTAQFVSPLSNSIQAQGIA